MHADLVVVARQLTKVTPAYAAEQSHTLASRSARAALRLAPERSQARRLTYEGGDSSELRLINSVVGNVKDVPPEAIEKLHQLIKQLGVISTPVIKHLVESNLNVLPPHEDLDPLLIVERKKGKFDFVACNSPRDESDKEIQCRGITEALRHHRATGAAYVAFVWTVVAETRPTIRLSQHPNRVEGVSCSLISRDGHESTLFGEIERTPAQPPRIKQWEEGDLLGGRFVDALRAGLRLRA